MIIKIKSGYSWEQNQLLLLTESQCNNFEEKVMKEILYLPPRAKFVLEFIIELLRDNADIANPDNERGFSYGDLNLLEYFYGILVCGFRAQLFQKSDISDSSFEDIRILRILYLPLHRIGFSEIASCMEKYNYEDYDISTILDNFHHDKKAIVSQLKSKLEIMAKSKAPDYRKGIAKELLGHISLLS